MNIKAKGILAHHFWGEYCATIGLVFDTADDAALALARIGEPWKRSERVLGCCVDSKALDAIKDVLAGYGADPRKIDSVAKSIDYGEPFEVTIPVENPDQLTIGGCDEIQRR